MNRASIAIIVGLGALVVWQWQCLRTLYGEEARLGFAGDAVVSPPTGTESRATAVTDAEMEEALATMRGAGGIIGKINSGRDEIRREYVEKYGPLMDSFARMSREQMASLYDRWCQEEKGSEDFGTAAFRMMEFLEQVNPAGALEIYVKTGNLTKASSPDCYVRWLRSSPADFLEWAKHLQSDFEADALSLSQKSNDRSVRERRAFSKQLAMWTATARILQKPDDPSVKTIAEAMLASDRESTWANALTSLAIQLENNEARLRFLSALHVATRGDAIPSAFFSTLAQRVPFAQVAQLADSAPEFRWKKPPPWAEEAEADEVPVDSSLRYTVAKTSLDSTPAERWKWLTLREQPRGRELTYLVNTWTEKDRQGTETWAKSLPPGELQNAAEAALKRRQ